jgi:hypothetical protein
MGSGADQEAVRPRECGAKLRVEPETGVQAGIERRNRRDCFVGTGRERESFDGGVAGEEAAGAGEKDGGVARVAGEGGVEKKQVGAAGGHGF